MTTINDLMASKPRLFARSGPKNNGYFAVVCNGRLSMGRTHKPMTKLARMAFFTLLKKGWRVA
jgi:hypothetical protein